MNYLGFGLASYTFFDVLGIIGLIGFAVCLLWGIVVLFIPTKRKHALKAFGLMIAMFIIFLVGALNAPSSDDDEYSADEEVSADVDNTSSTDTDTTQAEEKVEKTKKPSTLADVKEAIFKGMSDDEFKTAKESLNVEHPKSISVGDGNVGYVLQATDGFLVAYTDGDTIYKVTEASTMDEVDKIESDAEAVEKQAEEQAYEDSKIKVSGRGDTASDGIKLEKGYAIFDGSHTGNSNFQVTVQDKNGNDLENLVNEIGNYKGKTFLEIPTKGTYYLNVVADGSWNFNISQEPPLDIKDAPTTLQGRGDDVVFFNAKKGNYKFAFNHSGSSNFVVQLNGQSIMVNEIGNYSGSTRNKLQTDGYYALVINADGQWSAKIE